MDIRDYCIHMRTDRFVRSNGMEHVWEAHCCHYQERPCAWASQDSCVGSTSSLDPSTAGRASDSHVDLVSSKEGGCWEGWIVSRNADNTKD